jgi:hypothetical protein
MLRPRLIEYPKLLSESNTSNNKFMIFYRKPMPSTRNTIIGPRWGKLVYQLPGVITFAYDLRLGSSIPHRKGISEKYNFCKRSRNIINYPWSPKIPTKCCLGPQNGPEILGLENLENKNCQDENCNCQDESCM